MSACRPTVIEPIWSGIPSASAPGELAETIAPMGPPRNRARGRWELRPSTPATASMPKNWHPLDLTTWALIVKNGKANPPAALDPNW